MPKNPYNPDATPRAHAGAQALITHLQHTHPISRTAAQQLIESTGLAPRTADNIILKLHRCHIIHINGRQPKDTGFDNRANHTITQGAWWDR